MRLSRLIMSGLFAAGSAVTTAATAGATTFDWTANINYTDQTTGDPETMTGSGTLTATLDSGDQYTVTGITGTYGGQAITGLESAGNVIGGTGPNDNLVFSLAPYLDGNGIGFDLAGPVYTDDLISGSLSAIVLYSAGDSGYVDNYSESSSGTFALNAVAAPEPASLALLGVGLGALLLVRRNRAA